ncbi:MAG TPA: DEAD/DEAH box helicase [Vicinamibacterales bacterium]|jgi:ATP-dependent Lhr-like helicase|nr:DEAD/DEAH box helicase [Vicinamibacterales bacterium]
MTDFHPIVARWFAQTLGEPTAAQLKGWAAVREGRHALIAAPTGSGKTLAAFLTAIDDLFREGLNAPLPDEVRVVYVSPLKALSADIVKNLAEPRRGIRRLAAEAGVTAPRITAAVRTGDTTQAERAAMLRTPPHILVTTPESLYLLLTAERSREMLRTARTVIVDEIHAVIGTRRGAHLALSLERLERVIAAAGLKTGPTIRRIGLSATQNPIEEVARYLCGNDECAVVDEGHRRRMDLEIEIPLSPLEAVMAHEVWEEYYDRLARLITEHRTTLVFVNTRRIAERLARHLSERLGSEVVAAHHGSLSKERRLDAETRLKSGQLKVLVATASLELGIDIGSVDLACQIGSPHRIATLLQRVGRSGHTIAGLPKGRLFPMSRDDLVECLALLRSIRRGELDRIVSHDAPLDVLAQQIVAEASCRDYTEDELFELVRRAWPYRALARSDFDSVVAMTSEGFATRRGRRGALVHRDEVNGRLRSRRSARSLAITSGGAIPEVADYRVVLEPEDTFIGTVNEDFAIESMVGDIFQLGNASWQILQVGSGIVRVADAKGAPPNIPFWFGEAPARSDELSRALSDLRRDVDANLVAQPFRAASGDQAKASCHTSLVEWLAGEAGVSTIATEQAVAYLADARRSLGALPTQQTLVLERFFDESGGMQLVLHAPFGSRINKAWGLALRKRFCRQFNFELQAAATDDAVLLSLGPQHSFPLADVFRYLHPETARDVLVQAFLDAPVFQSRWRWNTTISLAVPRNRHGRKVPPQLQRMMADDLMAAVFPDAAACLENIPGDRQVPDHPLVNQTIRDCLEEAMDFDGLTAVLQRIHRGELQCLARDTPEPSPLAHEILNARPYAFLDDAPLEERRTQAVYTRRATEPSNAQELGALDPAAIDRVRDEMWPEPRDADELHDALMTFGFLTEAERARLSPELFDALTATHRATACQPLGRPSAAAVWVTAERLPELRAVHAGAAVHPAIAVPASRASRSWTREEAIVEMLRGRLALAGPTTAAALADSLSITAGDVEAGLLTLEAEGVVLRGNFSGPGEWCERRLLARIHRYTLNRLRAEIEPVAPADFMRFLFAWQHVDPAHRLTGVDGLRAIVGMLDGFELPARAWERSVLPARMDRYDAAMLDMLCLTGEVAWARLSVPAERQARIGSVTSIALVRREHADAWLALRAGDGATQTEATGDAAEALSSVGVQARRVLEVLDTRGASFSRELADRCGLDAAALRTAIAELVAAGLVTCDGFAGLRALVRADRSLDLAGRWSILRADNPRPRDAAVEAQAWALLRRYGVVFRRVLVREANAAPWRDLARVYRWLEARGEIRGGRFVSGMSGEQFALPDAVERLREMRRTPLTGGNRFVAISAADPLNLTGLVTPGERIQARGGNRIVYGHGVPLAVMEGDYIRPLADIPPDAAGEVAAALAGRRVPAVVSGYIGKGV